MEMRSPMKIMMVSSEAFPLAKAGGLGDVVSALAQALCRSGHDVRLLLPRYRGLTTATQGVVTAPLCVDLGERRYCCAVTETRLPDPQGTHEVPVYLLEYNELFDRSGIYGETAAHWFPDNPLRFAVLSRAAAILCRTINWIPDVFHSHDWPTALVSVYHRLFEAEGPLAGTGLVLSIHNLGYQGHAPLHDLSLLGIPSEQIAISGLHSGDGLNLLQGGISCAHQVVTVSPRYAREIAEPQFGFGLDPLIRARNSHVTGIINGIDYDVWDPGSDPLIPYHYDVENIAGKQRNRQLLQMEMGLLPSLSPTVIGMVSRLTGQKGLYELCDPQHGILERMLETLPIQVVVLGTGEADIEACLLQKAERYPNLAVRIGYEERLAHLIEAGSDLFLMPSRYEPCGLNQMYSLRYGTVPVVTRVGGLADTVEPYDALHDTGTGFCIEGTSPWLIFDAVEAAVTLRHDNPATFARMRARGMQQRFPWEASAHAYTEIYRRAALDDTRVSRLSSPPR
ncbi:MAG: glycogen synthase [Spirochaetaceae bacterium]|nr:MAG: glycogen synthase [Spirochaetaceae bacterium]